MWLLCDCQGQNTTELLNFCRDNLPEDIRTGICMPTYDSMKKYQGSWHIEEKTVFPEYFLIKESQRETLRNGRIQKPFAAALPRRLLSCYLNRRNSCRAFWEKKTI